MPDVGVTIQSISVERQGDNFAVRVTDEAPSIPLSVGAQGKSFLSGSGAPASSLGSNGDTYLNYTNGDIYKKAAGAWALVSSLVLGGGGGGSFNWVEQANAPIKTLLGVYSVYEFEAALAQQLYATVRVPDSYVAGDQLSLLIEAVSTDTSGNILFRAQSTLVRAEVDDYDSTTNQRTTTNAAITMSAANDKEPQKITLDITDSSGQVNGVAVAAGDILGVRLYRDTDTATGSLYMLLGSEELVMS